MYCVEKWTPQQFADLLEIINDYNKNNSKDNKYIDTLKINLLKEGKKNKRNMFTCK